MSTGEFSPITPTCLARLPMTDWVSKNDYDNKYTVTFAAISTFEPLFDDTDIQDNYDFTRWCEKEKLLPKGVETDPESCQSYFYGTKAQLDTFLKRLTKKLLELDSVHGKLRKLL